MEIAAFVDGLNLYHGMEAADLLRYRWLDITAMCKRLARTAGEKAGGIEFDLTQVVYCTSFVSEHAAQRRQDIYLQALQFSQPPYFRTLLGKYELKTRPCTKCGELVGFQKEKRTDVNLAVEIVRAASADDRPDAILLVSGDTDLIPAIEAAQDYGLLTCVAAPPRRGLQHLNNVADVYLRVTAGHLKYSPLPDVVHNPDNGYPFRPPDGWPSPDSW